MSMTRKDFEMFADAFGRVFYVTLPNLDASEGVSLTLKAFMDVCEEINPRFDRERFKDRVKGQMRGEDE